MEWKHIKNLDKSRDFAEMYLYAEISDEKVNGASFAYEMRYLIDYENVRKIKVKINSVGGDVMHAETIVSTIIDGEDKGICIETHGQGLMASSAGVIFLTPKKENRYCKDYARLMIHGVSFPDDTKLSDNDKEALKQFQGTLVQILSNRTGKKEAFFEELFTNGKDNWFTAKDMIKNGLINKENVEITDVKVDIPANETTAGVVVVYNKLTAEIENNINQNVIKMKKVIALLNLQEGVSEDVVATAVNSVQNSLKEEQATSADLKTKLAKAEQDLAEAKTALGIQNKASALEFVKNAIKEGKIDPTKEAEVLVQAEANLEGFKNLMGAIPAKAQNIINQIKPEGTGGNQNPVNSTETRSFRQLEKEAPSVLANMRVNNKAEYVALYNAQYNTAKTEADFK